MQISFLTKYWPCLPRNGILTHILEMFSSAMLLELFSEDVLLYGAGSLLLCFDFNFLSTPHRKLAGNPFHAMNLEMVEICPFRKNVLLHIRTARQNNDLIQAVLRDQGSKLWEFVLISFSLSKRTLKQLISDSCSKTAFSFDNKIYEQIDGVSMGSCLAPVLANIILTEFEKQIVEDLIQAGTIKFYRRYVDDTLVLIKPCDICLPS